MTFSTRHYVIKIYYLAYFDISYLFRIIHLVCIAPTCRRKFRKVFYTKHNFKSGPVILTFSQITKIQFPYNASSFPFINSALIQLIQQLCIDLSPKLTIKKIHSLNTNENKDFVPDAAYFFEANIFFYTPRQRTFFSS